MMTAFPARRPSSLVVVAAMGLCFGLGGCATAPVEESLGDASSPPSEEVAAELPPPGAVTAAIEPAGPDPEALYWWSAWFHFTWTAEGGPDFNRDALVADLIVEPVIRTHWQRLPLWRFHRRAAPDVAGHRFSFLFYTDPTTAAAIYRDIEANPLMARLGEAGILDRFVKTDPAANDNRAIGGTSDPNWSPALQEAWPTFIMGVSRTWLGLINQGVNEATVAALPLEDQLAYYATVNGDVTQVWSAEGRHGFLHHLNALFGYQPLLMRY
ncbi:MAG: hypothetical protein ACFCBW_02355 [Candidatus Competibacterales bacterium]